MRRFSLRLVAAFAFGALLLGVWLGTSFAAGSAPAPGSDQDPLISKSYVDQAVARLQQSIDSALSQGGGGGATVALQVVVVPVGQKLIGFEGTEFILRAGAGTIVGSSAGGVPDLTGAVDLSNGTAIPKNHLLLFPKNDGRGFLAVKELTVMVRGRYEVQP